MFCQPPLIPRKVCSTRIPLRGWIPNKKLVQTRRVFQTTFSVLGCSVLRYPRDRKINWYELKSVTQNQKVCTAFRKTQQYDHSEKVSGQPGGWSGCPETFWTHSVRSVFQKAVHTFEICSYSVTVWFSFFNGFLSDVRSRSFIFAISQFGHNLDRLRLRNCPKDIFGPQQLQEMWK